MVTEIESRSLAGVLPLKYEDGQLLLLDQRKLPESLGYFNASSFDDICFAIKDMVVRGGPSIGVAAAFGFAMEAARRVRTTPFTSLPAEFLQIKVRLDATRPTAVNLRWATDRMLLFVQKLLRQKVETEDFCKQVIDEALLIFDEHISTNLAISNYGADLLSNGAKIITHCNAGPLAACGWGTAIGVIRAAHQRGMRPHVFADETRPRNQGAKLTMWELHQDRIPATLICDNMSGYLMSSQKIDMVIVGADRIARNGDAANKIGTFNLAIVAQHHKVPFYVAAPLSTFDATIFSGTEIPIEERSQLEVLEVDGKLSTVKGAIALNPAFDVTPNHLIAGIITEAGILRAPYDLSIAQALRAAGLLPEQQEQVSSAIVDTESR
ncbi:MAG: S-methyl-5-thioribose-1-phosphate isomerase [Candidatus Obscuribacterales bacterium]|nr:S-methyl-5-thioribose-1-phosphate isomerase [Candidatus Obscuribacterales bacterium]